MPRPTTSSGSSPPTRSPTTTGPTGFGDGSPEGRQFRSTQFDGMRGFPQPDAAPSTTCSCIPAWSSSLALALGDDDVRIYQAAVWAKWAGAINYEQPLHQDGNHSLLPPRMEPGFWHLETFLYLSDVDEDCAPPRLVPRSRSGVAHDELYEHEVVATGATGLAAGLPLRRVAPRHRLRPTRRVSLRARGRVPPAQADWFSYDAFGRLGNSRTFGSFAGQVARRAGAVRHPPARATRSGTRRPWTPWPTSTPASTFRHGERR